MNLADFQPLIQAMPVLHQAFRSRRDTWEKQFPNGRLPTALAALFGDSDEAFISRSDLLELGKGHPLDLDRFIFAVILWGYSSGMRGGNFLRIVGGLENLKSHLSGALESGDIANWEAHRTACFLSRNRVPGLGLSTYSKFLHFLGVRVHGMPALILDRRLIDTFSNEVFEQFAAIGHITYDKAPTMYPEYLAAMHAQADTLHVPAHNLEMFLFTHGDHLKPMEHPA